MSVRQESIIKFETQIAKLFTEAKYRLERSKNPKKDRKKIFKLLEWKINLRITGCIFNNQRRGWIFYFSQIQDTSQLKTLDATIEKFCMRFNFKNAMKLKSLHKTYFETKRSLDSQKYIPNFDMFDVNQQRAFLELYLFNIDVKSMSVQEIESRFKRSIRDNIKELERDLKDFS